MIQICDRNNCDEGIKVILVGNKADLGESRTVSKEEGKLKADKHK